MTLSTLVAAVAEAATVDARGHAALIGIEPAVWEVAQVPSQLTPTFAVMVSDSDIDNQVLKAGTQGQITIQALDPDGTTLFFAQQSSLIPARDDESLPMKVQILIGIPMTITVPGVHRLSVTWEIAGEEHVWSRNLHVRLPANLSVA